MAADTAAPAERERRGGRLAEDAAGVRLRELEDETDAEAATAGAASPELGSGDAGAALAKA